MTKYNAVVSYPVNNNGQKRNHLVTVYYNEKGLANDKIIELADTKINNQNVNSTFSIEGSGIVLKKDHIKKTIFQ